MSFFLSHKQLATGALLWSALFLVLSVTERNTFQVLTVFGFLTLSLLPGFLTILLLQLRQLEVWGYIGLAIGFSVLELICMGLVGNTVLPFMKVMHPLERLPLGLMFGASMSILSGFVFFLKRNVSVHASPFLIFDSLFDAMVAFVPALFVGMSILGAIVLNNGGAGSITFSMLLGLGLYCALLIRLSDRLGSNVIPTALFFISLSLLFMTSLRGWYITGHDVQREYAVFELTKAHSVWDIAQYRDAYNACMSITILPTLFSNFLKIGDPYIYKILFQVLFATVPSILFLFIRRYVSAAVAFLSVLYFVSFPTFFGDMPMLNRQEIAFMFLALMLYILFQEAVVLRLRQYLFVLLGLGMILSHYSTTYTVIGLLCFLVVVRPVVLWLSPVVRRVTLFAESGIEVLNISAPVSPKRITLWMLLVLVVGSFIWTNTVTDTSNGSLHRVLTETIQAMKRNTKSDSQSNDVLYSLFSWGRPDANAELISYKEKVVRDTESEASSNTYYSTKSFAPYHIEALEESSMPLTSLGSALSVAGIDVLSFNYIFRQASAKLLQLLVGVGLLTVLFTKRFTERLFDIEFMLLSIGSLLIVGAIIVLPVLSLEYGLLRAFEQSLMLLGVFVVIGCLGILKRLSISSQLIFAATVGIVFLFSNTGVFTQMLGGYYAQLHLNNSGKYYDKYYTHESELTSVRWLASEIGESSNTYALVQVDPFVFGKVISVSSLYPLTDIYPAVVRQDAYIYLGYANVHTDTAHVLYKGDDILYTYPMPFLNTTKNLIYSNGDVLIYR